ncbi:carboxypeptidase regulatory-like domain-containing protein [Longitalea luteola]|uniref:carboxypeptidase regulatory-like domain-containing protein n=1 Tax=Longitalea luteola TaxID=2812563 RepID=UPI001A97CA85|nr:carboxypeptidase regulatory-like domain-containing protein [Longitalea luteola]
MNKTRRFLIGTLVALLFSPVAAQQRPGATNITFVVKDQNTGFAIPGAVVQVTAPNGSSSTLTAAANGKLVFTAVNGKYDFSITANGYKSLATYFSSGEVTNIEARVNLEPADNNARLEQPSLRAELNQTIISGYVRDETDNSPLAGVQVNSGSASAVTNSKGYFSLAVPTSPASITPNAAPAKTAISFTRNGYAPYTAQRYAIPDSYTMKVALSPLSSARVQQRMATQQPIGETDKQVHGLFDRTAAEEQQRYAPSSTPQARVEAVLAAAVPGSIRVGISCNCTSCSSVEVMTLEEYAQSGLDDEWIASWGAASLQAGAVAYRTYGAWYALHPVASSYDIAATTCNQVWQSDRYTSCINAAKATAGIVLVKNGAIFRSEYSAENNNSGCGNGYSGTGSTWPCISDARCAGYAKNGHGRGMCQWGSSRWASDKTYTWILNHYYNPGSVFIQLPPSPAVTVASFAVKDQSTGLAIASAAVAITKPDGTTASATTNASGQLVYGLDSGRYSFTFSKTGYKSLATFFIGGPNDSVYADINLDVASTARIATNTAPLLSANNNQMVLTGYVRDADMNSALAGVQVQAGNYSAITNANGFFTITLPAGAVAPGSVPPTISIQSTKAGYLNNSIQHLYVIPDTYEMQIALTSTASPRAPRLRNLGDQLIRRHGLFDKTPAEQLEFISDHSPTAVTARQQSTVSTAALLAAVPTVIRVATSCACVSCANPRVQVMSLESYVQTGVDDEWVSSWNAAALQAGTVAYRSRGAWFVQHPVASNYDLSAAACHQTWQTDRAASVKNAAIATAGIVLIKNGAIYKAEYCAETNNSGCGDGYSGTGTDYPCIADSRCVGRTKNGHGRGMCQWGSSFWGTDQTYSWILNHYYNPDSATIQTTTTTIAASNSDSKITDDGSLKIAPNPTSGSTITIEYTLADVSQPASIVVTDNFGKSARQRNVVLQPGLNRLSIGTSGLKAGIYNVTVRLAASGKSTSKKLLVVK